MSDSTVNDVLRRILVTSDPELILSTVDQMDFRAQRVSPAVALPMRKLQEQRDVVAFAASAPVPALEAMIQVMALETLEHVVEALGEHAEHPSLEQLRDALSAVRAAGAPQTALLCVLGLAIAEQFPAARHCRTLIDEDPDFALREAPAAPERKSLLQPKVVSDEVREQRRARRAAQKPKKSAPPPPRRSKAPVAEPRAEVTPAPSATDPVTARRRARVTPRHARLVDVEHELAGSVVVVSVPFDAVDPTVPEQKEKERPAVVIGASSDVLLVRGIYSHQKIGRRVFGPWRRLELSHVSYVADDATLVAMPATPLKPIGRLTDEEWNALW